MNQLKFIGLSLCALLVGMTSCRKEMPVTPPEEEHKGDTVLSEIAGFYLLNEGNMGSNKSTLDYYDYTTATYKRDVYPEVNPEVVKELGDVGNDLQIYGSRLYAVINCSNKVEVMEAKTGKRIGQVDIPNCRYICFDGPYAYVSSYAGPVSLDSTHAQIGYVARIDTATLEIRDRCLVGYQPDGVAIANGKLYVANSGGYMVPNYESTVSVIDLESFAETKRIEVAVNLHRLLVDADGQLWVSSRGDYYDVPSRLYCINTRLDEVVAELDVSVSNMDICGDSIYVCAAEWSYVEMEEVITYAVIHVKTHEVVCRNFISDGTEKQIQKPYGIKVNPLTHEIFVTDAKNYVNPGTLYCFDPDGKQKWNVRTGDIPAHISFVYTTNTNK